MNQPEGRSIADRNSNCDTYEYDIYAWNGVRLLAVEDLHKLIQVPHFNVFLIMQMVATTKTHVTLNIQTKLQSVIVEKKNVSWQTTEGVMASCK